MGQAPAHLLREDAALGSLAARVRAIGDAVEAAV